MTTIKQDLINLAGGGSAVSSVTLQVADWLGVVSLNSIIITITGILGLVYLVYKIRLVRMEYKDKIKRKKNRK